MQDGITTAGDAMSEDELKKRFKEFCAGWTRVNGELVRKDDYVDLVIDEARKEFPCYKCTLRCCMCGRECHEFKQWGIKWLGEST